jgi:hypothetical protein
MESMPFAKVTCAGLGGRCAGVRGTGGGSGVVLGCVAGRLEESGDGLEGFDCWGTGDCAIGDCAIRDVKRMTAAAIANRIGARLFIWLVGRAATEDVTLCRDVVVNKSTANRTEQTIEEHRFDQRFHLERELLPRRRFFSLIP